MVGVAAGVRFGASRVTGAAWLGVWLALLAEGCGGNCNCPCAATPADAERASAPAAESAGESAGGAEEREKQDESPHESSASKENEATPSGGAEAAPPAAPEPSFPEDASVSQAMAAVPQGTERANIDPERLGEPLQDPDLYAPCNVGGAHFKLRVAVWNGHAVGVDVLTSNKKLAACVAGRIRGIEWKDRVRSLNTVDYSF